MREVRVVRRLIPLLLLVLVAAAFWFWPGDAAPSVPETRVVAPLVAEAATTPHVVPASIDAGGERPVDAGVDVEVRVMELADVSPSLPVVSKVDAGNTVDAGAHTEPTGLVVFDAGARQQNDPRFTIRWGQPGLCGDEPLERMAGRRRALLASFIGVRRAGALILRHPNAPPEFAEVVGDALAQGRLIATRLLGPTADVALPVVYVYENGEQMRDVACVNTATQGYYDGAIHLPASDPDAARTVIHELMHHVLNTLGVRKPMWLHEGLAMYAADERWWEDPRLGLTTWLRTRHLPFPAMVEAFPHTADELFAGAAYYQSYQMVRFVLSRAGRGDLFWLVDALVSERLTPQSCFAQGLDEPQLEAAWSAFISTP